MKTITLINWGVVGIYAIILLYLFTSSNSQQDAAGRGMIAGFLFLFVVFLIILVVLNILPYPSARIVSLVIGGGPLILYTLSLIISPIVSNFRQKQYENEGIDRTNGSFYFSDPVRQQIAAAITAEHVAELKTLLQQPIPNLNESGEEHITLLDFATLQAKQKLTPQLAECMEILMAKGATTETADTLHSPTQFLVTDGPPTLLEWFLKKGANPNAKDASNHLPLLLAVLYSGNEGDYKTKKTALLLEHGADPNAKPPYDELVIDTSPLIYAADNDLWEICQLLLDKGANPAHITRGGSTIQKVLGYKEQAYTNYGKTPPTELTAVKDRVNKLLKAADSK